MEIAGVPSGLIALSSDLKTPNCLFMPLPPLRLIPTPFASIVLPNALTQVVYKNMEIAGVPPALSRYQVN
jgi:hypothetical protein